MPTNASKRAIRDLMARDGINHTTARRRIADARNEPEPPHLLLVGHSRAAQRRAITTAATRFGFPITHLDGYRRRITIENTAGAPRSAERPDDASQWQAELAATLQGLYVTHAAAYSEDTASAPRPRHTVVLDGIPESVPGYTDPTSAVWAAIRTLLLGGHLFGLRVIITTDQMPSGWDGSTLAHLMEARQV